MNNLPNAEENLMLFQADIYRPEEFEQAIQGCEFVCHVATPLLHTEGSQVPSFIFQNNDSFRSGQLVCISIIAPTSLLLPN